MTQITRTFVETKTHGSVALLGLMLTYLLPKLASKDGKIDIGDTLLIKSHSRSVAYLHFLLFFPFEP